MRPRRAAVFYNPVSGSGRGEAVAEAICTRLEQEGFVALRTPTSPEDGALSIARERAGDVELIVVAGGDGSVRETIEGLGEAAATTPIAVVPCGNANVLAREMGIPLDPASAIELALTGRPVSIDLAYADDMLFMAMVGIGWDARTVRNLDRLRRTAWGRVWYRIWADSAYVLAGLLALLQWRPERFTLEVDGLLQLPRFCASVISNLHTYGKGWAFCPDAGSNSGRLHHQSRKRFGVVFLAIQLIAAAFRRRVPGFVSEYGEGSRLIVRATRDFPVHIDGDYKGRFTQLDMRIAPGAALVVAPRTPTDESSVEGEL